MNSKKIIKNSLANSVVAVVYIALVSIVLTNGNKLFGQMSGVLPGMAFLLMFVFSAVVMGITIFGRPILWYLDGFKKEAVKLVVYTLGFLFVILVFVFAILILK